MPIKKSYPHKKPLKLRGYGNSYYRDNTTSPVIFKYNKKLSNKKPLEWEIN
jgi:hypothetical protein